jgi:hypothetical protein
MRQTLWAEKIIERKETELVKVDDYIHIHVIPENNKSLLNKKYKISNLGMEETWRNCIKYQEKYKIISPKDFLSPIENEKYNDLLKYLQERYW